MAVASYYKTKQGYVLDKNNYDDEAFNFSEGQLVVYDIALKEGLDIATILKYDQSIHITILVATLYNPDDNSKTNVLLNVNGSKGTIVFSNNAHKSSVRVKKGDRLEITIVKRFNA